MSLPYRRPDDPVLAQLYDAATDAATSQVGGDRAPGLITAVPTLAELRQTPGDVNSAKGPPAITVAGTTSPGDGGHATYLWMPGSTQQDNNGDNTAGPGIVQVIGVGRGRWWRPSAASETSLLTIFTATANGLAPLSGGGTAKFMRADAAWVVPPTVGTSAPGYAPTSPGGTAAFLRADGTWAVPPAPAGKTLIRRTYLTGTSLAAAAGTTLARAYIKAGGGGGGGASGSVAAASGGAEGGEAEFQTSTIPGTWNFVLGAAGTAGSSAGGNGGAGGNSTFSDGTTTVTANGGPGGTGSTAASGPNTVAGASAPAVSTNGSYNGSGEPGGAGLELNNAGTSAISGSGGGKGGGAGRTTVGAGTAAVGPGAGGGGAMSTGAGAAGGVGNAGWGVLEEWG